MARATLVIDCDTTAIRRAMGEIPGVTRRAQSGMTAEARRGSRERGQATQRETTAATAAARQVERERRAAEKRASDDARNRSRERSAAETRASRERIAAARNETRERIAIQTTAIRATMGAESAATRAHASEEARRTAATRREEQARARAISGGRRAQQTRMAGAVRAVGAVAYRAAATEHGSVQDARRTAAATDSTLAGAVGLAGGDANEAAARARMLHEFAARNRLSSSDMADAAASGQAEFNVLGQRGQTSQQREAQFRAFMADYAEGANTFADPSQHVRLSGMLRAGGFDDSTRTSALSVIGAATQAGSVEEGDLIRGGMASMIARMRGARANAGETQQQAQLRELTAAVTEMEVAKSGGTSALRGGNILRGLTTTLRGSVVGDRILTNIGHADNTAGLTAQQQAALRSTLYEADPTRHGQQRLRAQYQSGVGLAEGFAAAGISGQQMQNLLAGSGHGNAQSIGKPARDLLGSLMSQDASGRTGIQNIRAMEAAGGISAADRERMTGVRQSTDAATLAGQEETLLNERRTGTAAGLSDVLADFTTMHPILTGVTTGLTGLATSVAGWMGTRAALGYSATVVEAGAAGAAGTGAAASAGGGLMSALGAMAAGTILGPLAAAGAILLHTRSDNDSTDINTEGLRRARASSGVQGGAVPVTLDAASTAALAAAIAQNPPTITPHDAAHVAANAPPARR